MDQFARLRDLVRDECGIYFPDRLEAILERRVRKRIAALQLRGPDEYLLFLRQHPERQAELEELLESVAITETSFFRAAPQLDMFRDCILPEIMKHRGGQGQRGLRIWSAACASGEEPYTLAMLLRERLENESPPWSAFLYANDLSARALETARAGVYTGHSARKVPLVFRRKYFRPTSDGRLAIDPALKAMVHFQLSNLVKDDPSFMTFDLDVIFCRNVLIYFDASSRKKVLDSFWRSLRKGGYLVIGAAESLHGITDTFKMIQLQQSVAYCKS